jgi:hypothetical protein
MDNLNSTSSVFVATTTGYSEILQISKLPVGFDSSAMSLRGSTTDRLKVSRQYDAFIKAPTGIVERFSGHRGYSAKLSDPIDEGDSWQLAMLIAHLLSNGGLLSNRDRAAQRVIWASGIVEHDIDLDDPDDLGLVVRPIQYLETKLKHAAPLFDQCQEQQTPLVIALSSENLTNEIRDQVQRLAPYADLISYDRVRLSTLIETWSSQDADADDRASVPIDSPAPPTPEHPKWFWPAIGVSGLAAVSVIGLAANAISTPNEFGTHVIDPGGTVQEPEEETAIAPISVEPDLTVVQSASDMLSGIRLERIRVSATDRPNQNCFGNQPEIMDSSTLGVTPNTLNALTPLSIAGKICVIDAVELTNGTDTTLSVGLILSTSQQPLDVAGVRRPMASISPGDDAVLSYGGRSLPDGEGVSLQVQDPTDLQRVQVIPLFVTE